MKMAELMSYIAPLEIEGTLPVEVSGITADSRKVRPGFAFLAMKGITADGHNFIKSAIDAGASVIISEKKPDHGPAPASIILNNVRKVWGPLSLAWAGNPQDYLKLAAVTGTNGKTTVSTLVHQTLTALGHKAGLMGTVSIVIGEEAMESRLTTADPEQIASNLKRMQQAGCTHVVMEVSSHALDQERVNGLDFSVAGFTNLTDDHLDYHKTREHYLQSKKRLFDGLRDDMVAIVNSDDPAHEELTSDCRADVWKFGLLDGSVVLSENSAHGLAIELDGTQIRSKLTGKFNACNVSLAYLMCRALGCSGANASAGLAHAKGARGRLEKVSVDGIKHPIVFVDYAHTPDALDNVLSTLREVAGQSPLKVVFGCGGDRDKAKRPKMGAIAVHHADSVIVTSDNPRTEPPDAIINDILAGIPGSGMGKVKVNADRKAAIREAISGASPDDIILIAGKGHETYQEIMGVRHPMDDRETALEAIESFHFKGKGA